MKFYHIKEDFITYLRQFDTKVAENKNQTRPYVGIVLEVNSVKYYAPFSSPKPKHKKMKNGKDFRKINNGLYGAINFNNMIPVSDSALIEIDIANIADVKYRRLLQNQYNSIKADEKGILKTAENLRKLIFDAETNLSAHDKVIKQRCCDLVLLAMFARASQSCGTRMSMSQSQETPQTRQDSSTLSRELTRRNACLPERTTSL